MAQYPDTEATTRNGLRPPAAVSDPPPSDAELLGKVMAECSRTSARVSSLTTEVGTLAREVSALAKAVEKDQGHLVQSSSASAAAHTSNRMAVLLGLLWALYQEASPVLHGRDRAGARRTDRATAPRATQR